MTPQGQVCKDNTSSYLITMSTSIEGQCNRISMLRRAYTVTSCNYTSYIIQTQLQLTISYVTLITMLHFKVSQTTPVKTHDKRVTTLHTRGNGVDTV